MDDKLLLQTIVGLYELSLELSDELEQQAANAERLSNRLYQVLERINPVHLNSWDEDDTWEDYKKRTINYINGGK